MTAPAQLLSLLPPPPEPAGWPAEFVMADVVAQLRAQAAKQRARQLSDADDPEPYVPCSQELYPARRRAQRLSFCAWRLVHSENNELQRALEAVGTGDRLRLAVLRLRELREQL